MTSKMLRQNELIDLLFLLWRRTIDEREATPTDQRARRDVLDAREALLAERIDALGALYQRDDYKPGHAVLFDFPADLYAECRAERNRQHEQE